MARFGKRPRPRGGWLYNLLLPVALFALVVSVLYGGLDTLDRAARDQQLRSAEEAIRRAAVHCYAVEGQYPPSLQYLQDRYGVQVDRQRYIVHYQPVAGNLMPDILIIPMDADQGGDRP